MSQSPGSGGTPSYNTPLRRASYATVVAGASGLPPSSAGRLSGAHSHSSGNTRSRVEVPTGDARPARQSGTRDMAFEAQGLGRSSAGENKLACPHHEDHPPFFTPSYLRQSRHVQRLHRAYDEHVAELQDQARLDPPQQPPALSTSSSNANLGKLHASQNYSRPAAVQDIIERLPPPSEEDKSHPLPSKWSERDKWTGLEVLAEGTEVRFNGITRTTDEAASIRSDHPMPRECGVYYFEVTILSRGKDGLIGIGFSAKKVNLHRLPGWETDSWAYHGDDGYSFACTASGKAYGPRFSSNDVIGCGVNFRTGNAFFTKNGVYQGTAFTGIKSDRLYPSVGMKRTNEHLRVNFGRCPFVFDIDRMMEQERRAIKNEIHKADVTKLHPPDQEDALIHKLIGQYLAHEGYVETAKAFARDVQDRSTAPPALQLPNADDDIHAINRQKIRKSILDGDIDRALKYSSSHYPHVLEDDRNRDVYFRLRCRKFIEMMRRHTDLVTTGARTSSSSSASTSPTAMTKSVDSLASNGHGDGGTSTTVEQPSSQMELDDQLHREVSLKKPTNFNLNPPSTILSTEDVDMDASIPDLPPPRKSSSFMTKQSDLLSAALAYGQELQHEFGGDPRPHIKKQLQDLFAIIAYPNPADSPIAALLDPQARVHIAEEVNGAILVSLGKPSSAALEKVCAQTEAFLDEAAAKHGGSAAFINVRHDFLQP